MIRVTNLSKTYRSGSIAVHALRDVDITVNQGEFVSIMGPSGSGKSTLMNILGCLDKPSAGEYFLDKVAVSSLPEQELARIRNRKIGFVFQNFNLLPRTPAVVNVEVPLAYSGVPRKERRMRAMTALEIVGLGSRATHKPNELSGGEKQRVAIARAIINEPAIILADEPTGALDTKSGNEVLALLERLHDQGMTIMVVTHDPEVAKHTEKIYHFLDGRIVKNELVEDRKIAVSQWMKVGG